MAFTTGILIGIGETRKSAWTRCWPFVLPHEKYGHIQEVIVQPFRAKGGYAHGCMRPSLRPRT